VAPAPRPSHSAQDRRSPRGRYAGTPASLRSVRARWRGLKPWIEKTAPRGTAARPRSIDVVSIRLLVILLAFPRERPGGPAGVCSSKVRQAAASSSRGRDTVKMSRPRRGRVSTWDPTTGVTRSAGAVGSEGEWTPSHRRCVRAGPGGQRPTSRLDLAARDTDRRWHGSCPASPGSVFARPGGVFARPESLRFWHGSCPAASGGVFARPGDVFARPGGAFASPATFGGNP
jgi:hypothetical protein